MEETNAVVEEETEVLETEEQEVVEPTRRDIIVEALKAQQSESEEEPTETEPSYVGKVTECWIMDGEAQVSHCQANCSSGLPTDPIRISVATNYFKRSCTVVIQTNFFYFFFDLTNFLTGF